MKETELFTEDHPFHLHSYPKYELAWMYFPGVNKASATRSLRRWIMQCRDLNDRLIDAGYNAKQKIYTRQQVELIIEYIGLP